MGRKPNALIAEFFERGHKIADASNRYQHTCKTCGEKFPKGRIDSLTNHIVKHCPAISNANRQKAHQILSDRTQPTDASYLMALDLQPPPVPLDQQQTHAGAAATGSEIMSGLEALAEVSRQHLDPAGRQISTAQNPRKRKRPSPHTRPPQTTVLEHTQLAPQPPQQLPQPLVQQPQSLGIPELLLQDPQLQGLDLTSTVTDTDNADLETVLLSINQFVAQQHRDTAEYPTDPPIHNSADPAMARLIPDQLALAASAATEIMPKAEDAHDILHGLPSLSHAPDTSFYGYAPLTDANGLLDPQLHPSSNQMLQQQEQQSHNLQSQVSLDRAPLAQQRAAAISNAIPHAQFLHDFRLDGDPHKSKTRGRFTPDRRKEVQEVRRQGACIRCRMLKKPCSGGTPCSTCQHVESARLWKSPCMRARIADEFDLYSAGLHYIAVFHEVNNLKPGVTFERGHYAIEAKHVDDASITPVVLPTIRGVIAFTASDAPALSTSAQKPSTMRIELLNQDGDTISSLVDQYIRRAAHRLFEQETSSLMRPTLALASQLSQQKPDPLLSRALELWSGTQMLIDPSKSWHISSVSTNGQENNGRERTFNDIATTSPLAYHLLTRQLKAQVEKRCANLAKSLMNDFERRLLQRGSSSSSHFETFLTAIILLNCVEKICYLFHTWGLRSASSEVSTFNLANGFSAANYTTWPLDRPASYYISKGSLVSDVVSMLLRMRSIPPATVIGTDGVLHFDARAAGKTGHEEEDDERTAVIAAWFASLGLRAGDLVRARDGIGDGEDGGLRGWEGRFVSRLLLGDG